MFSKKSHWAAVVLLLGILLFYSWNSLTELFFDGDGEYEIGSYGWGPILTTHELRFDEFDITVEAFHNYEFRGFAPYDNTHAVISIDDISANQSERAGMRFRLKFYEVGSKRLIYDGEGIPEASGSGQRNSPNAGSYVRFRKFPSGISPFQTYQVGLYVYCDACESLSGKSRLRLISGWK